jgi:MOSC domain-containing protein YiiM
MSELTSIVYKPAEAEATKTAYTRLPLREARLIAGCGIEGDAKGGRPERALNIMSVETLESLAGEGFRVNPGQMGEQLIIAGLVVDTLPIGTRLQIGDEACVELTQPRTGCNKFEACQEKPAQQAAERLGMMANVVAGGTIRVGDSVTIRENQS